MAVPWNKDSTPALSHDAPAFLWNGHRSGQLCTLGDQPIQRDNPGLNIEQAFLSGASYAI